MGRDIFKENSQMHSKNIGLERWERFSCFVKSQEIGEILARIVVDVEKNLDDR